MTKNPKAPTVQPQGYTAEQVAAMQQTYQAVIDAAKQQRNAAMDAALGLQADLDMARKANNQLAAQNEALRQQIAASIPLVGAEDMQTHKETTFDA